MRLSLYQSVVVLAALTIAFGAAAFAAGEAVGPAQVTDRLETHARNLVRSGGPTPARIAVVDYAWPVNPQEYRDLGRFTVILISVVTGTVEELPLKRAFVKIEGKEQILEKLFSTQD